MKDLKYLIEFEQLLEDADNELVKQAQADGNYAIGKHDAQGLARVFDRPAQYWLSLQELYLL